MQNTLTLAERIELVPQGSRKSFYGKAYAISNGEIVQCLSYNTIVAEYNRKSDTITINGYYSPTTNRHINAFCAYVGKRQASKQEKLDCVSY